jgi:proteic killer suppression protein
VSVEGAIASFRNEEDETFFFTGRSRRYAAFARVALRRLQELANAHTLDDLGRVGGNRLELLRGDRAGQHSIRINQQYRICFVWRDRQAHNVEIVDYH